MFTSKSSQSTASEIKEQVESLVFRQVINGNAALEGKSGATPLYCAVPVHRLLSQELVRTDLEVSAPNTAPHFCWDSILRPLSPPKIRTAGNLLISRVCTLTCLHSPCCVE